ncbi:MAG: tannase/feruloyl esterase family alpha/beta hydrolase [Acidobacteriaceae bacterium]
MPVRQQFISSAVLLAVCCFLQLKARAQSSCEDLAQVALPHATVTLAQSIPAGPFTPLPAPKHMSGQAENGFVGLSFELPAFCKVTGVIKPSSDSEIRFELWLPTKNWNGRFQQEGNGGYAGLIPYWALIPALRQGYATAATDDGHTGGGPPTWAIGHPEKVIDFGYRAVHETAGISKTLLRAFYGNPERYSYFIGCSDGGREALMEAQRFPDDFHGILAGAPANYWTDLFAGFVWNGRAFLDNSGSYIPPAKLPLLQNGALAACDEADGVKDGILADPLSCRFDPAKLKCIGAENTNCLTASQVDAAKKIYAGPRNPRTGKQIFPGFEPGDEAGRGGWAPWITGPEPGKSLAYFFAATFFADMVFGDPKWGIASFDFDKDIAVAESKVGAILNAENPDLRSFQKHGGKLIQYHGWADYAIPPRSSVQYFDSVAVALGGADKIQNFYRLYLVPGLEHCSSGPGPTTFLGPYQIQPSQDGAEHSLVPRDPGHDMITALEHWVERGVAPSKVVATKYVDDKPEKGADRTWLLCPYPMKARWDGKGNWKQSSSYTCEQRKER